MLSKHYYHLAKYFQLDSAIDMLLVDFEKE